uniref:Uncharacterized protein n=1 Tax=Panagrolaimus sp. ES5 TaxID=591445 RepID=A0AC34FZF4_9BILA
MAKILLQLHSPIWTEPKKHVIVLPDESTVAHLLECQQIKDVMAANNFTISSLQRFEKDFDEFVDLSEANSNDKIADKQKFQIFFNQEVEKFSVKVTVDGSSERQVEVPIMNIKSVKDLLESVLKESEFNGMSLKTVKMYDHDFEEKIDVDDLAIDFDKKEQYFIYLKSGPQTFESSTAEKLQNFAVNEMPPNTVTKNPRPAMINIVDAVVKNRIQIPQGQKITRQALGNIADLGELYDAHTDTFCSRLLFNNQIPEICIKSVDTQRTSAEFAFKDSISEKLEKLNLEAELQASFLAGLIKVKGHGKYLSMTKTSTRQSSGSLICNMSTKASFLAGLIKVKGHGKYLSTTKTSTRQSSGSLICNMSTKFQSINVDTPEVVGLLSPESVRSTPNATHVVVGIQWGAVATATLTYASNELTDKKNIDAALEVKLKCIKTAAAGSGTYVDDSSVASRNFSLDFYMDALPSGDKLPQTVEESIEFMRKLPDLIKTANNGRGTPIFYELLPLSAFQTYLNSVDTLD